MPKINFKRNAGREKNLLGGGGAEWKSYFSSDVMSHVTNQAGSKEFFE